MGQTIRELFGGPGIPEGEGSDAPFDFDNLGDAFDAAMANRPPIAGAGEGQGEPGPGVLVPDPGQGAGSDPAPAPPPDPSQGAGDAGEPAPPPAAPAGLIRPAAVAPLDPLAGVDPAARAELAILHQALVADPQRREQVLRAALGQTAVTEPSPLAAPPPPAMPEEIEPGSVEALLWQQNQDTQKVLAEMREETKRRDQAFQQAQAVSAAERAGANFTARYGHVLSREDIGTVASRAGARGLPFAIVQTNGGNLEAAMFEAMELTLRGDDALVGKVLGAPTTPPTPPGASPPATQRKRTLHALSGAGQPSGGPVPRPPLSTRGDGKLDEASRQSVLQEAAAALRASREG